MAMVWPRRYIYRSLLWTGLGLLLLSSCKKREEQEFIGNEALLPHRVSTIRVENYVNRLYIDLIGRSPLPAELAGAVDFLRAGKLSAQVRTDLVIALQTDTSFREGDISYKHKYYQRIYDIVKARMCEGASDDEFLRHVGLAQRAINVGRVSGDSIAVYRGLDQQRRNQAVVDSRVEYMAGEITLNEMFQRMLDNDVYDEINMNTFNFVRASFDNLFNRFPTQTEFNIGFGIIERNEVGSLLGGFASNKQTYCELLCHSAEFYEGIIHWTYLSLMGREATSQEVHNLYADFAGSSDFQALQKIIMITDEYADF